MKHCTKDTIQTFIGILIAMGINKLPRLHLY